MNEALKPGHDQGTLQPAGVEAAKAQPIRVFLFEPHPVFAKVFVSTLDSFATVTTASTIAEAMGIIKEAYEKDQSPFDRALVAPGYMGASEGIYPGERIIFVLKRKGMDPFAIALHSSRPLERDAELNGVAFLQKGSSRQKVLEFLSNPPLVIS